MKSIELKENLVNKLIRACNEHLEKLTDELSGQSVFAYTLYCASGCDNIGVAACTREGLKLRNEQVADPCEPSWYGEVTAAEWDYVYKYYELFDDSDEYIEQIYEIFDDGELEDVELDDLDDDEDEAFRNSFLVDVVTETLSELKTSGRLSGGCFESDLLLGMQFGDPDKYVLDIIESSSKKLNSKSWHEKILLSCDAIKKAM